MLFCKVLIRKLIFIVKSCKQVRIFVQTGILTTKPRVAYKSKVRPAQTHFILIIITFRNKYAAPYIAKAFVIYKADKVFIVHNPVKGHICQISIVVSERTEHKVCWLLIHWNILWGTTFILRETVIKLFEWSNLFSISLPPPEVAGLWRGQCIRIVKHQFISCNFAGNISEISGPWNCLLYLYVVAAVAVFFNRYIISEISRKCKLWKNAEICAYLIKTVGINKSLMWDYFICRIVIKAGNDIRQCKDYEEDNDHRCGSGDDSRLYKFSVYTFVCFFSEVRFSEICIVSQLKSCCFVFFKQVFRYSFLPFDIVFYLLLLLLRQLVFFI